MFPVNLKESKKFALMAAFIALLLLGLIAYGIIASGRSSKALKTRQELILNLPYLTADYSVVYSENKDQIYVNVLKPPYEENRQKALDWIRSQGANPTKLNLVYTPQNR